MRMPVRSRNRHRADKSRVGVFLSVYAILYRSVYTPCRAEKSVYRESTLRGFVGVIKPVLSGFEKGFGPVDKPEDKAVLNTPRRYRMRIFLVVCRMLSC